MASQPIGKFQILGTLGKGAHSLILHIRCSFDGRQYALKVVPINSKEDQKYLEQAQHEFRVGEMLHHPNLIKVHALEAPRDWLFRVHKAHLLIEYVNGQTLDAVKGLSIPRLIQVFAKTAAGMEHMHRRHVCHADLKPGNIMLSRAGEVKIIDYGLAWIRGENKARVQGTPEYMAPEQIQKCLANERTDIYNFGATMYRLTTWRLPPSAAAISGSRAIDGAAFKELLKPVGDCMPHAPPKLCDLIHRCLEYSPANRPETMTEVRDTLDELAEAAGQNSDDRLDTIPW